MTDNGDKTLREHLRQAGRSRSPAKLAALAKNRQKLVSDNPSPRALYMRWRREQKKRKETT